MGLQVLSPYPMARDTERSIFNVKNAAADGIHGRSGGRICDADDPSPYRQILLIAPSPSTLPSSVILRTSPSLESERCSAHCHPSECRPVSYPSFGESPGPAAVAQPEVAPIPGIAQGQKTGPTDPRE